ncbi:MAG: DNA-binding response regulator [Acidobacteriota bacterium]
MTFLLVTDNLMTRARLEPAGRAAGAEGVARGSERVPDLVAVDLTARGALETIASWKADHPCALILAFGPHVQTELLAAAREAGATEVVPRGAAERRLVALLRRPEPGTAESGG